ncbi:Aldo-keto reductase [Rhodobacter sp. AKP1]|nr:Aldo-keto reductase [Rhodobacter sp. AKP1]
MTMTMTMTRRRLGQGGPDVSTLGLGCMGMSEFYGKTDRKAAIDTIHAALEAGVVLLDTRDFYGMGDNEMLLSEALRGKRDQVFLQVKFGAQRAPDGTFIGADARPNAMKTALSYSLRRLGTDHIDLYMAPCLPDVAIEETVGAMGEMLDQGYIRHIGLMNVDAEALKRAHDTRRVAAVQQEYSLTSRDVEQDVLPLCRALGVGLTAYGVLGRGLLTGSTGRGEGDLRSALYRRFQGENLTRNQRLARALAEVAETEGITAAQAAIAWVASRGDDIVPLVGAKTVERLTEALGAPMSLSVSALAAIEKAVP